ncbi:MAG: hypothetical protein WAU25_06130 [Nitrososphaeraceae archaeon]
MLSLSGKITSSLDLNSIILGKEERKKKWLTLPFIPMNMTDIDYSGNGENGRTSITAATGRSVRGVTGT